MAPPVSYGDPARVLQDQSLLQGSASADVSQAHPQASNLNDLRGFPANAQRLNETTHYPSTGQGRCNLCQVDYTSVSHRESHLSGQKHRKKVSVYQLTQGLSAAPIVSTGYQLGNRDVPERDPVSGELSGAHGGMAQTGLGAGELNVASGGFPLFQPADLSRGPNGEDFIMNGSRGKCFVCNVDLTSLEHAKSHLEGQKHKKKCASAGSRKFEEAVSSPHLRDGNFSSSSGVLMCSLCQVPFSCLANAEQHFVSEKHKKRVQKEKGAPFFSEQLTAQGHPSSTSYVQSGEQTLPKHLCDSVSPFVPLQNPSSGEIISNSPPVRDMPSPNPADSENTVPKYLLKENNAPPLLQPVPIKVKAVPDLPPSNNTPMLATENCSVELSKGMNTSKNTVITSGNLSSDVSEIAKVKNKEFMDVHATKDTPFHFGQTASPDTGSVVDNNLQSLHHQITPATGQKWSFTELTRTAEVCRNQQQSSQGQSTRNQGQPGTQFMGVHAAKDTPFHFGQMTPPDAVSVVDNNLQSLHHQITPATGQNWSLTESARAAGACRNQDESTLDQGQPGAPRNSETVQLLQGQLSQPQTPFYFDGSRGVCNACGVELTSKQVADQHLNGQRHQKKVAQWKQLSQQFSLRPLSTSTPVSSQTLPGWNGMCASPRSSPLEVRASPGPHQQIVGVGQPGTDPLDDTCFFNGSRGFCKVCNIEITSLQHYDQHRLGKPHGRSRQRYIMSQQGIEYPLFCDVCKKPFTGQESAQQHFTSARHKTKVEILGKGGREVEQLDCGRMIMRESEVWYVCDICDCPLNTRQQFEIHKESLRHKKNALSRSCSADKSKSPDLLQDGIGRADSPRLANSPAYVNPPERDEKERHAVLEANRQHLTFKPHTASNASPIPGVHFKDSASALPKVGQLGFLNSRAGQTELDGVGEKITPVVQARTDTYRDPLTQSSIPTERYGVNTQGVQREEPSHAGAQPFNCDRASQASQSGGGAHFCGNNNNTNYMRSQDTGQDFAVAESLPEASNNAGLDFASSTRGSSSDMMRRPPLNRRSSGHSTAVRHISTMERQQSTDDDDDEDEVNQSTEEEDREVERVTMNISEHEVTSLACDLEKLHISERQQAMLAIERSSKPGFKYYCKLCKQLMNTKENMKAHLAGRTHQYNAATQPIPPTRRHFPPVLSELTEGVVDRCNELTKDIPRVYQIELLEKAMLQDTVVYLPTGTGKTLIAVQSISLMLEENATRPILFLVDKVLLVLQQGKYIREQLSGKIFTRPDVNKEGVLTKRELLIMVICGGLFSGFKAQNAVPIWKHDIIITTADFCINMLEKGLICWSDFSLVVLDEVHHCHKSHPYLRVFAQYHNPLRQGMSPRPNSAGMQAEGLRRTSPQDRWHPKVLGLSASPAGKQSIDQTYNMLKNLLANLGGAHIAMVEEAVTQLQTYQSNAVVLSVCVPMSDKEADFTVKLLEYLLLCYIQLARLCPDLRDSKPPSGYFASVLSGSKEAITNMTGSLMKDMEPLHEITTVIFNIQSPPDLEHRPDEKNLFDHLKMHLTPILLLVTDIGSNSSFVTDSLLKELAPSEKTTMFMEKCGLPCEEMYRYVEQFAKDGSKSMTMYTKLMETLSDPKLIRWSDATSKALVVVKQRQEARQLAHKLRETELVQENGLRVSHLVGHGKGAQDGGMDVKKQKKLLDNQEKYRLLVSTSLLEEGVDFQTLQLVVCLNPPTSVRALVQIRGRARRENSHFVILCKLQKEKEKVDGLLDQEKNMQAAARRCLMEDRMQQP